MSQTIHRLFISILVFVTAMVSVFLIYRGLSYYLLPLEERVYHADHGFLKPSGVMGHGIGILGSFLMLTGIFSYMARKRFRFMSKMGLLKHWLEFHIFLCTLGPIMILFHTAYKFGGLVAISFWSMVAVFLSGIIGRFIYIRIPKSIEGRALTLKELSLLRTDPLTLREKYDLSDENFRIISEAMGKRSSLYEKRSLSMLVQRFLSDRRSINKLKRSLKHARLPDNELRSIVSLVREDMKLSRRIESLEQMQNLFRYWHVVHLPFALVMLVIMVIHIAVTIIFGYRWIF